MLFDKLYYEVVAKQFLTNFQVKSTSYGNWSIILL